MINDVTIRKACAHESEVICDFQVYMAKETESIDLDRSTLRAGVQAVFSDPSKGYYLVCEENKKIIACALLIPEWSDWRNGTVLWIHSVYVLPFWRKKGVFRKIYHDLKNKIKESKELKGLRLYVDKRNQSAQKVYKNLGMSDEHYGLFEWLDDT